MLKNYLLLVSALALSSLLSAQISLSQAAQISTGQVSAHIQTRGALIDNFLVPGPASDSSASLLGEVSLWMAGTDEGNNLFLAIQSKDSMNDEFVGGYRGVSQSKGIWKVTLKELRDHLSDFQDNGHIDNPVPAIYAWPGMHNPYSLQYNGFAIDTLDKYVTASFQDTNHDGIYNPDDGDYPFGVEVGVFHQPTEMLFAPFHVNMKNPSSNLVKPLNASALLFSYDCDDANFLEAAVFCQVSCVNQSDSPIDSFYLGFYIDGNIGNPHDDYMGSLYDGSVVYFYNGDNIDEGGFGSSSPLLVFRPYWLEVTGYPYTYNPHSVMTIHPTNEIPPPPSATDDPMQDEEFLRYLDGKWRDGRRLSFGGNGRLNTTPTPFIFSGNPASTNEWSEVSAQSVPGDRRALLSFVQDTLAPHTHNRSLFSLSYIPPNPIAEQINAMKSHSTAQFQYLYVDFFPPDPTPFDSILCLHPTSTALPAIHPVRIFPNPAHDQLTLQTETAELSSISLYNTLGMLESITHYSNEQETSVQLPLKGLTSGIHLLQCTWKDGSRKTWKVLVE